MERGHETTVGPGVGLIENVDFQDFWTLRLRHLRKGGQHYCIRVISAPCRLSTDPKIHDVEWPFYVRFSIFTITSRVSAITLRPYRRVIYRIFLYDVTNNDTRERTVKLRSAEYCGCAKGLWIFRRRKVAGDKSSKP